MEELPLSEATRAWLASVLDWLTDNAFVVANLGQLVFVGIAFLIAKYAAPKIAAVIDKQNISARFETYPTAQKYINRTISALLPLALPLIWLILQWITLFGSTEAGWPHQVLNTTVSLLTAWVVIRMATTFIADPSWARIVTIGAWTIAALNIVGFLGPTEELLESLAIDLGGARISLLSVVKAGIVLVILLWLAGFGTRALESRLQASRNLTPSIKVLFGKLGKITFYTIAVVAGLNSVGIDLTAFAIFSGAVGLGLGFGLQKVVSNLISGVILLLDRSVKPGDVIAVSGTYGQINALGARYVSVITRDGIEHLIPNEELISNQVENWSHTDKRVRLKIPIGIDYSSDVLKARELAVKAAGDVERVLKVPVPLCHLLGFGDNAVNLELRVWIDDPHSGVVNVKSDILLNIWQAYQDNEVAFPYPQRDLHIRSSVPLEVKNVRSPKTSPRSKTVGKKES